MRGFTVDDALISVRYARHLAFGHGWRFDAGGPSTDGVTPLPWAVLLVPFARAGARVVLARAQAIGFVAAMASGAWLGAALAARERAPIGTRAGILAATGLSVPVAAYAVSGMETPVAMLFATVAAVTTVPFRAAWFAGLAAAFRPEMAPWAAVLAIGADVAEWRRLREALGGERAGGDDLARLARRWLAVGGASLAPFAACVALRMLAWGRPTPLAIEAKPSGIEFGVPYALAGLVISVVPVLVVAPVAVARSARAAALVAAAATHGIAIALVGGDWMPYSRLWVPVVPSLAFAACLASEESHPAFDAIRGLAALALGVALIGRGGTSGRSVGADRDALIASASPWLADTRRVAALDVGWVSAATEADIVDLAGLTDPEIAALPGGHTSKRIQARFFLSRDPDTWLVYAPEGLPGELGSWRQARYPRAVEARLVHEDAVARRFQPVAWLPLGTRGAGYVLLRRVPES
jgi:hypothetical protein